jgi:hypothetical protein
MYFYMTKLETIMHYIIIYLTHYKIQVNNSVIRVPSELRKRPIGIRSNICSAFVFDNISTFIHIHFENMKTNMGSTLSDLHASNPFPPLYDMNHA